MYSKKLTFAIPMIVLVIGVVLFGGDPIAASDPTNTPVSPTAVSNPVATATRTLTPTVTITPTIAKRSTPTRIPATATRPPATATLAPTKVLPTATQVPATATRTATVTRTPTKVPTATATKPSARRPAAPVGALDLPGSGWWTGIQVANIGTAAASQVYVTLYDMNSSSMYTSTTQSIASNASFTWLTTNDAHWLSPIPNGFIGSGVVTADQPILAIVNEQNNPTGPAAASYSGFRSSDTDTSLLFPLVKHDHGSTHKTTTFFVQNTTGTAANIYATFRVAAGVYTYVYPSVGAYKLQVIKPSDAGVPTGATSLGSLQITSTVQLAGVYNEHEHSAAVGNLLAATGGFPLTKADYLLYVPVYKQLWSNAKTGVQVMNTGDVATTVYATYTVSLGGSGTYYTNKTVDPSNSQTFFYEAGWPDNTAGAMTLSASQPIVAIVNETKYTSPNLGGVYAAFPASKTDYCATGPLWKTRWSGVSTGQQSTLVVQNAGSAQATVYVTFTITSPSAATYYATPQTVDPGKTIFYGPGAIAGGPPTGTPALGSVKVCATQKIAAMVQESTLPGWTTRDVLNYETFPSSQ